MLVLPFLLGLAVSDARMAHIPLFLCWLVLYLFSFPVLQWIKTGNKRRYLRPAALYGAILVPLLVAVLLLEPWLLVYGALLLLLFMIPVHFAKAKNERALFNDIIAILLFCSFIYPVAYVGKGRGTDWTQVTLLFTLLVFYFVGTALYVKTVVRGKKNPRYYWTSLAYHALLLLFTAWLSLLLLLPFGILLLRAAILPKKNLKIKHTGMTEIGFAVLLFLSVLVVYLP